MFVRQKKNKSDSTSVIVVRKAKGRYKFAMEFEYDSRKKCASQMKRKQVFFSEAHFATPFPTVNWTYTFSAKEKDTETSLSYFGSRYYSSDLSIWLSVDPMSDKYPSLSPYVYCANNPIKLVDPNGEDVSPIYDTHGNFLGTDDEGLTGKAIVMKKENFKQGMS